MTYFLQKKQSLFFISLILLEFCSCQSKNNFSQTSEKDSFANIKAEKVVDILQKSFDRIGGLAAWKNKSSIHFKKYFALYDENGETEMAVDQVHDYFYTPKERIEIHWMKDGKKHQIVSHGETIDKTIDGQKDIEAKAKSLNSTVKSATFVMDIPFKLLDDGVQLKYAGTDTLENRQVVEVIRADYDPATYDHHTTPDIWWYYFDQKDYRLCGYMVQHLDHYSYVKNLSYQEVDGFLLTKDRKSYRVDSLRNILYLRADYSYTDFRVGD